MNKTLLAVFLLAFQVGYSQTPRVPSTIYFANLELRLNDQARQDIQSDVDALYRSQKYFDIKLARVKMYFPIIERIFQEEKLPEDFKYLVIQESALISDAISTSNAVGFWQFKDVSAREVGLRVDGTVDERMNIVSSTHGAAKYIKKNNFFVSNWLYALLAYNTGPGGVEPFVEDKYKGAKRMNLDKRTHWYIKKFLAHKIAFEGVLDNGVKAERNLYEYLEGGGQSLEQIAAQFGADPDDVKNYNKWLRRGKVPTDKTYAVIIPGISGDDKLLAAKQSVRKENTQNFSPNSIKYPVIRQTGSDAVRVVKINGIPGIIGQPGEELVALAGMGGIELSKFLAINEIDITFRVKSNDVFYYKKKRNKGKEYFHTLNHQETLWMVSQKYGIKKSKLLAKNRIKDEREVKPGLILWLRHIRPANYPVEYVTLPSPRKNLDALASGVTDASAQSEKDAYQNEKPVKENMEDDRVTKVEEISNENELERESVEIRPESPVETEKVQAEKEALPLFHVVEAGETLYAISRKYDVKVGELLEFNGLDIDDGIKIGQKIYLKNPFPEYNNQTVTDIKKSYITYTVKKGDTMYMISKKYNVTIEQIVDWNNKDNHHISVGEDLKILVNK